METGNNFTPQEWIFFPEADSFSKDQVVLVIGKSDGVDFLICSESDNRPLGSVISIDFQDFKIPKGIYLTSLNYDTGLKSPLGEKNAIIEALKIKDINSIDNNKLISITSYDKLVKYRQFY